MSDGSFKLWFGKHKGKSLRDIPREYLDWCLEARAGGGEAVQAIAEFLEMPIPRKKVRYEGQLISRTELERLKSKSGFTTVNRFCDGIDVMGVANCTFLFDPISEWLVSQEWDGETAPWLDQSCDADEFFHEMFG